MKQETETFEKPINYNPNNVCYWEEESKQLMTGKKQGAILSKAKRFLQEGCIKRLSEAVWECKPLKDYNKTTHVIRSYKQDLCCSCQGYNKKSNDYDYGKSETKPFCSHTVAVKQFCFLEANK